MNRYLFSHDAKNTNKYYYLANQQLWTWTNYFVYFDDNHNQVYSGRIRNKYGEQRYVYYSLNRHKLSIMFNLYERINDCYFVPKLTESIFEIFTSNLQFNRECFIKRRLYAFTTQHISGRIYYDAPLSKRILDSMWDVVITMKSKQISYGKWKFIKFVTTRNCVYLTRFQGIKFLEDPSREWDICCYNEYYWSREMFTDLEEYDETNEQKNG